ncbi:MAG: hypothetical protein ACREDP_17500, partial [Bradyrhizobium sp.]
VESAKWSTTMDKLRIPIATFHALWLQACCIDCLFDHTRQNRSGYVIHIAILERSKIEPVQDDFREES